MNYKLLLYTRNTIFNDISIVVSIVFPDSIIFQIYILIYDYYIFFL